MRTEVISRIAFVCSDMWEPYLKLIRERCSEALHILDRFHIVANINKALDMAGEIRGRFTVHHTPKHGSWLNQAEIEIGLFTRQCLGNRRISDLKVLLREARPGIRE